MQLFYFDPRGDEAFFVQEVLQGISQSTPRAELGFKYSFIALHQFQPQTIGMTPILTAKKGVLTKTI